MDKYGMEMGLPPLNSKSIDRISSENISSSTASCPSQRQRGRKVKISVPLLGEYIFDNVKDAAMKLGVTEAKIYNYIRNGGRRTPFCKFEYVDE